MTNLDLMFYFLVDGGNKKIMETAISHKTYTWQNRNKHENISGNLGKFHFHSLLEIARRKDAATIENVVHVCGVNSLGIESELAR